MRNPRETVHAITIEIDENKLHSYSDEYLAAAWHFAQWNPAEYGDKRAGDLVEKLSREIAHRWLRGVRPEVWKHQGRDHYWQNLSRFAKYEPGDEDFEAGQWVHDPERPGNKNADVAGSDPHLGEPEGES